MVIVTDYVLDDKERGLTYVKRREKPICPCCEGKLRVIGSRNRGYIDAGCISKTIKIRRLKCVVCGKIHHELPDILVPYKRHCSETVEKVVDEKTKDACCDESTMLRIKRWFLKRERYFEGCLESITARLNASATGTISLLRKMRENPGWLKELVRSIANSNLWIHTRSE